MTTAERKLTRWEPTQRDLGLEFEVFGITDRGLERERNEDHFLACCFEGIGCAASSSLGDTSFLRAHEELKGALLMVADGMGGHRGGARASEVSIEAAGEVLLHHAEEPGAWYQRLRRRRTSAICSNLNEAVDRARRSVESLAARNPHLKRMGTTLTILRVTDHGACIAHVGDTRCYLLRDGRLEQLTTDHTVAEKMVEEGIIDRDAVHRSPLSNVLWNVVGGGPEHEAPPEIRTTRVEPGDVFLLCSDGLTKHVNDESLRDVLASAASAEVACRQLVQQAIRGGGSDNVTVVIARVLPHP
jgi:protein phosphatase